MDVRWMAVLTGFAVDVMVSLVIMLVGGSSAETLISAPDLARPDHLLLLAAITLSTGVGGYVAGRLAPSDRPVHGLLVGVVGVLYNQLGALEGQAMTRVFVVASAVACLLGALGGLLAQYLPRPQPTPPRR